MPKLKKNVVEFIKTNVKPEHFPDLIEQIEGYEKFRAYEITRWQIYTKQSKLGVPFSIFVTSSDFDEVEGLKPNVWYPREMFDGNPKGYGVLEAGRDGELCGATVKPFNSLFDYTTHFMYIEKLEVKDED